MPRNFHLVLAFLVLAGCARELTVPDGPTGGASSASTGAGGAAAAVTEGSAGATIGTTATDTSGAATGVTAGVTTGADPGSSTGGPTTAGSTSGTTTGGTGSGSSAATTEGTTGGTGSGSSGSATGSTGSGSTTGGASVVTTPPTPEFRGDDSPTPAFGGWAWGNVPADAVAKAGFDWFETGYPGDSTANDILRNARVRPFAYINLGELDPTLASQANYTGPILRANGDWGTQLVDVTDASWQAWLIRRTDYAYSTGSRGVKWDVATPDVPPGKTRADVNAAIASIMQQILERHPDLKFIFNQGFEFALAYPQYVHGIETEGLFSASSYPAAYLQPWLDPWYWGPQYQQAKAVHQNGTPIFAAEYADPSSDQARQLYGAIVAQGFVPYVTNDHWNIRGLGYNVAAGW